MADNISKAHRSWNMSRIRSRDTKPEMAVRSLLHGLGYRFRMHVQKLPGVPDVVLSKYRTAIFVHGCYWHRHPSCKYAYNPKSNKTFWQKKFAANVERHKIVARQLRQDNWSVITVWECEIRDTKKLARKLRRRLN